MHARLSRLAAGMQRRSSRAGGGSDPMPRLSHKRSIVTLRGGLGATASDVVKESGLARLNQIRRQEHFGSFAIGRAAPALLMLLTGCGGSDWPRMVDVPPERVYELSAESTQKPILLPGDTPFVVHDRESSQDPGQDGTAQGESDAKPDGTAFCRATATAGGSASGDFLIGHVFHNSESQSCSAVCTVELEFSQKLAVSAGADALTVAEYHLEAFVRDSSERIVRRYPLADSMTALGPRSSSETAVFDLEFEMHPRTAYHVVLAGRVKSSTKPDAEASAEIELKRLQMELVAKPGGPRSTPTTAPAGSSGE